MEKPEVSVIIPARGEVPLLATAASSSLGIFPKGELVLVDDGITLNEGMQNLLREISEHERARIIKGEGRGQCAARNLGLREAKGDYVIFVDADDMLMKGTETAVEIARNNNVDVLHNAGYMVSTAETYVHIAGKTRVTPVQDFEHQKVLKMEGSPENFLQYFLQDRTSWTVGTKIFRREFLLENNIFFPENIGLSEHIFFLLPCMLLAKIYYVTPHMGYFYRLTDNGLMRRAYTKADLARLFEMEAEGLALFDKFFAEHADLIHDPSLIGKAKSYFLQPIEGIIAKINSSDNNLWGNLDEAAQKSLTMRLLSDNWWRNHVFGGFYRQTEEKEQLLAIQKALEEQRGAADGLIDRLLQAPRVIVVASIYTFMLCTFMFKDWEKSIILCGGGIPAEVFANMKAMGLLCYNPEGGAFVHTRILETIARYAERHKLPIYGNDDTPEATHFVKLDFTAVEDGMANYDYEGTVKMDTAIRITPDGERYLPFGFSDIVKKIVLTGKHKILDRVKDKVTLINPQQLWSSKTSSEKERIYKVYSFPGKELKKMMRKGRDCLFIGECFATVGLCRDEDEIAMYKEIIEPYGEEHVIYKPHHQDKRDWAKILPKAAILPRFFPIDLMKYIGLIPRKVIGPYSSASYGVFPKEIVDINFDLMKKYNINLEIAEEHKTFI